MLGERHFAGRDALLDAMQEIFVDSVGQALAARERASLLLSGGSTPRRLYERLADAPLDWTRVDLALVDERWVPADHEASNERMLRETLLRGRAASARLVSMYNGAAHPAAALADREAAYRELPRPFDLLLLGMGPDGHTASLFPHARGLDVALRDDGPVLAAVDAMPSAVTGAYTERMTLSLAGLLGARRHILLLTGADKLATLRAAQAGDDVAEMPIRALLGRSGLALELYYAD